MAGMLAGMVLLSGCAGTRGGDGQGLKSANADVRRERALEIGQTHYAAQDKAVVIDVLTSKGQSDPNPLVRSACLEALRKQDRDASLKLARQLITDSDPMVRWDATKALASTKSPTSRAGLLYMLEKDSDRDARREAAKGLGSYDDDEVIEHLIQALADRDRGVIVAAYRSLQVISGQSLPVRPSAWQEWYEARGSVPPPPTPEEPAGFVPPAQTPTTPPAPAGPALSSSPPADAPASGAATYDEELLRQHRR